jgi:hypothetical protein
MSVLGRLLGPKRQEGAITTVEKVKQLLEKGWGATVGREGLMAISVQPLHLWQ